MKVYDRNIEGVFLIESASIEDRRGLFSRLFCAQELQEILTFRTIVQVNHSMTHSVGAVRGLHFQNPPHAEMKIVRCLSGRVFDVAVDLRQGSSTFMKWTGVELTSENRFAFVIPEGCAHGFQVLEEDSELLYLHTAFYTPDAEGAVRFDDPRIGISWPLEPTDLSTRDLAHPYVKEDFGGVIL